MSWLRVSTSGFYAWLSRGDSERSARERSLIERIVNIHRRSGSTYGSRRVHRELVGEGMLCSMSRKGDCYDNAVVESFFGSLKTERVHRQQYRTREEARRDIFAYIELFYNRRRLHSSLGYLSPAQFEAAANAA